MRRRCFATPVADSRRCRARHARLRVAVMVRHGASWSIMVHHGPSWFIMVAMVHHGRHGASWCIMVVMVVMVVMAACAIMAACAVLRRSQEPARVGSIDILALVAPQT